MVAQHVHLQSMTRGITLPLRTLVYWYAKRYFKKVTPTTLAVAEERLLDFQGKSAKELGILEITLPGGTGKPVVLTGERWCLLDPAVTQVELSMNE